MKKEKEITEVDRSSILVISRFFAHGNWLGIQIFLEDQLEASFVSNPLINDKALLKFEDENFLPIKNGRNLNLFV